MRIRGWPSDFDELAFSPLTAVHVANVLAESEQSAGGEAASLPIDAAYLTKLGKLDQLATWKEACLLDE